MARHDRAILPRLAVASLTVRQPFPGELNGTFGTDPSNPTMAHTLGNAAREAGVAKSTILRMIKRGDLSATRTDNGWSIEPVELRRAFQDKISATVGNHETALLRAELEGLRTALAIAQDTIRAERSDKERLWTEIEHLRKLLPAPKPEPLPTPAVEAPALTPAAEPEPTVHEVVADLMQQIEKAKTAAQEQRAPIKRGMPVVHSPPIEQGRGWLRWLRTG